MVKNRVLIDVDGVIANFIDFYTCIVSETLKKEFTITKPLWDIGEAIGLSEQEKNKVHSVLFSRGAALNIKPYDGAVEAVNEISEFCDIYFVTAPLEESETWAHDRIKWLTNYFGQNLGGQYILTRDKFTVRGDIFIDDKTENIIEWKKNWPSCLPILWAHEYNSLMPGIIRTNKWSRVKSLSKHFKRPS